MENINRKRKYNDKKKKCRLNDLVEKYTSCIKKEEENLELEINQASEISDSEDSFNEQELLICDYESSDGSEEHELDVPQCSEIQQLQEWIIRFNVPHAHVDELIKILRPKLLPTLPKCTKTLLKCNILFEIESMKAGDGTMGEFFYFGIKSQLESSVNVKLHECKILELIINIDGFSPFKSSSCTVWPILCKIYTKQDLYEPFSVAVYSGSAKPKYPAEYLKKFVQEINDLQHTGVNIEQEHFDVKIKFFVCDTPARSYLKCIKSHTAFNACERCRVLGKKVNNVTVFLQVNADRKTDEDFKNFVDEDFHTGASILTAIEPPLNITSQFILDPMHLLYLGCTKRVLQYLLSPSTFKIRLSANLKQELKKRTTSIIRDIPDEFPRKMRSSDHYIKYKAVEYKFFLLYAAPIVLKKLLPSEVYNHFMLFVVACRILHTEKRFLYIDQARSFLITFVEQACNLYGDTFLSLNVHNLIHICDDIEKTGCSLREIGAFSFESYLGSISCALRSPKHIVKQYCHRRSEKEKFLNK